MSTQWPDDIELELHAMAQGGDAVGRWQGRAVFASGGLPTEHVHVRLHERQKAFARGRVTDVSNPAPERVPSFCALEQQCGAADWRWIEPTAQRRFKADILREQLQHLAGLDVAVAAPEAAADPQTTLAYRTSAELHVAGDQIGYFVPGTRRVVDIPACCLHHPLINAALAALRPLLGRDAGLRGVTVRCSPSTGQLLATLDGKGATHELAQRWRQAYPRLVGVTHAVSRRTLDGHDGIEQLVGDVRFHVSASSFFQVNYLAVQRMVARVRSLLAVTDSTRLLDLYCGVGLFALSLAADVAEVFGIEEWAPAIKDARRSATLNQIGNARFAIGSVEQVLASHPEQYDRVVLDPPRRGCAPEVLNALVAHAPERIVYVSCHPGTLARDCKQLAGAGYRITSAEIIDMFPHTHHVESIVALERGNQV